MVVLKFRRTFTTCLKVDTGTDIRFKKERPFFSKENIIEGGVTGKLDDVRPTEKGCQDVSVVC